MSNGDVHTIPHNDAWANRVEGNSRVSNIARTKAEAQAKGRQVAVKARVEHHIHKKTEPSGSATATATTRAAPTADHLSSPPRAGA